MTDGESETTAPRAARTTTGVRFAGRTGKGFLEEKDLARKGMERLCVQRMGRSVGKAASML